ncbi:helix-turn-helix transcriptional regulator [Gordonibacter pamelaeae]|uniref:XRE family transcriptional regulator n=2 Tax=Gordonibacter pamelaeae TaxID=471189 RepID=A0A369LZF3_9ACTN|nr:helix-turn-helix transcriptional regulator [Gordonibacter pamelaeae]MCB6312046.1 helix-turn-helix domain-containing protein [Gordonibacter pamelaeae]RDB63616.1 XRE family transcriptional regulator [Gordonibacter pamelaeae]HJH75235.1 helix-turn-helix domain-containing protein [Eggerthellaceae bacterium]
MSFRDNMQHLRASRNMTQEQLAMLLGVSRQSVSKWEAERAYPEMDKLLRMCALFDCTLDELVCGDLTARPSDGTARVPAGKPQDVTGYDQAMRTFAWKLPLGIAVVMLGAALALLLSDPAFVPVPEVRNLATVTVFVGAAVGLALVLPASFERSAFRKEHPFVDDFYTADQRSQARSLMTTGLVVGAVLLMAGLAATIVLQADVWLAGAAFLVCAAAGAFVVVRGCLLGSRCNLARYNRRSLGGMSEEQIAAMGDDDLAARARRAKRERGAYAAVMCAATAVGLVLAFTPAAAFFLLAWPVGGIVCLAIRALRTARGDR